MQARGNASSEGGCDQLMGKEAGRGALEDPHMASTGTYRCQLSKTSVEAGVGTVVGTVGAQELRHVPRCSTLEFLGQVSG